MPRDAENDFAYDYLPKLDVPAYDVLRAFELMHKGKMNGYFCQGFNPLLSFPNKGKITAALSQAQIPGHHGSAGDRDGAVLGKSRRVQPSIRRASRPRCSSCRRPASPRTRARSSTRRAGCNGTWAGGRPSRRSQDRHLDHGADLPSPARALPEGGRRLPRSDPQSHWPYKIPAIPTPEEIAKEINGYACVDIMDAGGPERCCAGKLLDGFAQLRDDGTTACGCWIYSGCFTEKGNKMARRDDRSGRPGRHAKWAFSWPANRRILYNRAAPTSPASRGTRAQAHRVERQPLGRDRRARHRPTAKPATASDPSS